MPFSQKCLTSINYPFLYRKHDPSKIARPFQHNLVVNKPLGMWLDDDDLLCTEYPPGTLLHGPSGAGKTRAAFAGIMKTRGSFGDFKYERAVDFKHKISKAAQANNLLELIGLYTGRDDDYEECGILFIDDLDKAKFTPAFTEALFEILEARCSNEFPTIITTQIVGDQLLEKIKADSKADESKGSDAAAEAIVRRLRDPGLFWSVDFTPLIPCNP